MREGMAMAQDGAPLGQAAADRPAVDACPRRRPIRERAARLGRRIAGLATLAMVGLMPTSAQTGDALQVAAVTPPFIAPPAVPQTTALLSDADVDRYRQVFAAQSVADWRTADDLIPTLVDRRLIGHVLAQRLLAEEGYIAGYAELRDWLAAYADHPQADRIFDLAQSRRPAGSRPPRAPTEAQPHPRSLVWRLGVPHCPSLSISPAARDIERRIFRLRRDGRPGDARALLDRTAGLTENEVDRLRGHVAAGFYYVGEAVEALEVAEAAVARSGGRAEQSLWIAGLSLWRLGEFPAAAERFQRLAIAECASAWERTAGAFWARGEGSVDGDLQASS